MYVFYYYFIGFVSIGTDGARTRSFRLDRASTSDISGEQQIGYIISWWIGKLLGRAGFEPA
ncbi:hypothetical protein Lal_00033155 [Lupinus albus]|nr:hypothetical protein Lal_00044962 [Lupinus albus]KAF1876863.1 hypothetical protein Lal_00033155 [Lupinus albus]